MKNRTHKLCGIVLSVLMLFAVSQTAFAAPAVQNCVVIEQAQTSSGEVEISEQHIRILLEPLTMPGDSAEISITLRNCGTQPVQLVQKQEIDCGLEDITVSFPNLTVGEQLAPGERCVLTLAVVWNPASTRNNPEKSEGTFGLHLKYSNGTLSLEPDPPQNPDAPNTGDDGLPAYWGLLLVCSGAGAVLCLVLRRKGEK